MPTLNEYFRTEAHDFLTTLERAVAAGRPDASELHRAARGLRGAAQMAREERFFRAVSAFEGVTRSLAAGALSWSEDVSQRAHATIADLRELLEPADVADLEARAADVAARWQPGPQEEPAAAPAPANGVDEFRQFAGREAADIAAVLDQGITALQSDPMDREALRAVLRRQRALLGAARLEEIPVVADVLRAIEDLTRVVAKLDVGVKQEWLDIYRVARDGLQGTIASLLRGENPEPSHAVSRLRHMRRELLDRYGEGETVSAAHEAQGLVQAQPVFSAAVAEPDYANEVVEFTDRDALSDQTDDVLELDDSAIVAEEAVLELDDAAIIEDGPLLELDAADVLDDAPAQPERGGDDSPMLELESFQIVDSGADAGSQLQRALQLRAILAPVAAQDPRARAALDELLDILRSALE